MRALYYLKNDRNQIKAIAYLTPDTFTNTYLLNRIEVARGTNKGEGWGTKLLTQICQAADQENVELVLGVSPDDEMLFWPLVHWYIKFGFEAFLEGPLNLYQNVMIRRPRPENSKIN